MHYLAMFGPHHICCIGRYQRKILTHYQAMLGVHYRYYVVNIYIKAHYLAMLGPHHRSYMGRWLRFILIHCLTFIHTTFGSYNIIENGYSQKKPKIYFILK